MEYIFLTAERYAARFDTTSSDRTVIPDQQQSITHRVRPSLSRPTHDQPNCWKFQQFHRIINDCILYWFWRLRDVLVEWKSCDSIINHLLTGNCANLTTVYRRGFVRVMSSNDCMPIAVHFTGYLPRDRWEETLNVVEAIQVAQINVLLYQSSVWMLYW